MRGGSARARGVCSVCKCARVCGFVRVCACTVCVWSCCCQSPAYMARTLLSARPACPYTPCTRACPPDPHRPCPPTGLLDGEQAWRKAARSGPLPGVTTALGGFRVCRSPAGAGHGAAHNGAGASAQHPTGRTRGLRPDPGHGAGVGPGDGDLGQVYVLDSPGVLAPALRDMGLGSGHGHGGQWGLPPKPGGGGKGGGGGGGPGGGRGARAQAWEQQGQEQPGDGGEATAARLAIAGLLPVDGRGGLVAEGRVLRHLVQVRAQSGTGVRACVCVCACACVRVCGWCICLWRGLRVQGQWKHSGGGCLLGANRLHSVWRK